MSIPPVPPSNPDGTEPGQQPAPGTGPKAPQYGQNAPQYGQNAPQYGQMAPQAPEYGQNAPQTPQYGQNPPGYGKAGYGHSPYAQYPSGEPQGPGPAPKLVNTAFWLIIAAGVLSLISSLVFAFGGRDYVQTMLQEEAARQGEQLPPGALESLQSVVVAAGIIGGLISLGLYTLVAFLIRKGKNWARIVGTVFAVLSVLGLFGSFAFGPVYGIVQVACTLVGIAAIVMLYLPTTSPYFQKRQSFANPYGQPGNPYGS